MIIKQTITSYLEATEQKFGSSARAKTVLKHRGGRTFFLKKHYCPVKHRSVSSVVNS